MITLSAAQAISPAIERTKQFLFRPFRLGTFLKLALVAFLTEGGMTTCNFSSRLPTGNNRVPDAPHPNFQLWHMHWPAIPIVIAVTAVILLIVIPIVLLIAYLLIRLRFSYFDCVLRQQHRIAPAWSLYHRQAMRYLGLSLCINVFFWAYLAVAGIAIYTHFKPLFEALGSDNKPGFAVFLPVIGIVILLAMVLALISLFVETALG